MLRHPLDDPMPDAPCECKYEIVQDQYMRASKAVFAECFRCSVKRAVMAKNRRRWNLLWRTYVGALLLQAVHSAGEIFRWWG